MHSLRIACWLTLRPLVNKTQRRRTGCDVAFRLRGGTPAWETKGSRTSPAPDGDFLCKSAGCQPCDLATSQAVSALVVMCYNFLQAAGFPALSGRQYQIARLIFCVFHAASRQVLQLMLVADFSGLCRNSPGPNFW
ncbi:hypothetical protein BH11BAC5_BH11BAC5_09800 [soil metagenome]